MPRPKKDAPQTNGFTTREGASNDPTTHEDDDSLPTVAWLSLVKAKGGYAVLRATTLGKEVTGVEVLHGPLGRAAASAALRTEMARAFLVGKGPV